MGERYDSAIDLELVKSLEEHIIAWKNELYELLPGLPENLEIVWDNKWLIANTGIGGATLTKHKVTLSLREKGPVLSHLGEKLTTKIRYVNG